MHGLLAASSIACAPAKEDMETHLDVIAVLVLEGSHLRAATHARALPFMPGCSPSRAHIHCRGLLHRWTPSQPRRNSPAPCTASLHCSSPSPQPRGAPRRYPPRIPGPAVPLLLTGLPGQRPRWPPSAWAPPARAAPAHPETTISAARPSGPHHSHSSHRCGWVPEPPPPGSELHTGHGAGAGGRAGVTADYKTRQAAANPTCAIQSPLRRCPAVRVQEWLGNRQCHPVAGGCGASLHISPHTTLYSSEKGELMQCTKWALGHGPAEPKAVETQLRVRRE